MKTEFRKLIIMTHENRRSSFTHSIQELGVLHIEENEIDSYDGSEDLVHEQNLINGLISFLKAEASKDNTNVTRANLELKDVINGLVKIEEDINETNKKIEQLKKAQDRITPWGNYDYEKFEPLIKSGFKVLLGNTDKKKFNSLTLNKAVLEIINQSGSIIYFVIIAREQDHIDDSFESFPLPPKSLTQLDNEIQELERKLDTLKSSLTKYLPFIPELERALLDQQDQILLKEAEAKYHEHFEGKLISISAWFPINKKEKIVEFLEREQVAWQIRKPEWDDDVPVVLKNRKYPKLFEPITKIFELPNYYETDLTPFLAVFYPILFAYCLGDMGYGFVLTLAMVIGYFTFLKNSKRVAFLGLILGSITMIMGLIKSGSLFGIMLLPDHPVAWISQLSDWIIIPDDSAVVFNAFNVALMIGVIQILTGIVVAIYNNLRYSGKLYAIAPFGKLLIVSSLIWIFLVEMQGVERLDVMGGFKNYMLIVGVILVVFFHRLDISIMSRIGGAFMPLFFIFTGILGDVLSYVRLFALGLASSVLGLVVNQIGMQIMEGGIISIIIGIIFLLFGHTLNFGIAALGSFVHPLRLTFVEFYGNVGFKGKGLPYRPLSKSS